MDDTSDLAFVDQQLEAAPAADAAATETVTPVQETVDKGTESTETPVETPVEGAEGEEKPAEDIVTEGEGDKPAEGEEQPDDFTDELSVNALNKKLEANPALKAALEKDTATKNLVYTALRRSAKLDQYEGIFTSPQTAKFTLDTANEMVAFDRMYRSEDPNDHTSFLQALKMNSLQRDEQGNVITDENGNAQSTGAYERLMGTYRQHMWTEMEQMAKRSDDAELQEAIRVVREKVEGVPSKRGAAAEEPDAQADLPADVKARLRRLDEIERQNTETQKQGSVDFVKGINVDVEAKLTDEIKKVIDVVSKKNPALALSDYERKNVVRDSIDSVKKNLSGNTAYKNMLNTMLTTSARNAEGKGKIVNFAMSSIKQTLFRIVAAEFSNATRSKVSSNAARNQKINTQTNRVEPQTTGRVPGSQSVPDFKSAVAEATKTKGKPLSDLELVDLAQKFK